MMPTLRLSPLATLAFLAVTALPLGFGETRPARAAEVPKPVSIRPAVPGKLLLHTRSRKETPPGSGAFKVIDGKAEWNVSETAIIVCDMWSDHPCKLAAQRVDTMAPRMNAVLSAARAHGVMIIHAPSGGVGHYAGTPYRKRMQQAPPVKPPVPLKKWCYLDKVKEPPLPIDDSDGGCDDPEPEPKGPFDRRQHAALKIIGFDGVSDSGVEIYNFLRQAGITNVVLMGVHTNMCVLGRPFGIRQMCNLGMNVALARDLTDAMYDPRDRPNVSHTRGTEMVIEHIETYWCPSILGEDLTRVVPGSADPRPTSGNADRPERGDGS